MWVDVLDCWQIEAGLIGHCNLKDFARSKPDWETIEKMSNTILRKYLPGADFADNRDLNDGVRDKVFKNVALQKQHGLMYLELSHAMNHGDVGHIL